MRQLLDGHVLSGLHQDQAVETTSHSTGTESPAYSAYQAGFLTWISWAPTFVAAAIALLQLLRLLVRWRPQWTKPFVEELPDAWGEEGIATFSKRQWTCWNVTLCLLCVIGFVLRLLYGLAESWIGLVAVTPWLINIVILAVQRPRTAPISVLTISISQSVFIGMWISYSPAPFLRARIWTTIAPYALTLMLELFVALACVMIILCMPLREPLLRDKEISKPYTEATSRLRSPEDNLTLWQFMTVSWMRPLIRIGSQRQLQDEDVWQLAYEFQHQRLHENFRLLKGTVIQRLIRANAIDLVILTFLGLLELVAQYAVPVLLQLLLSSMEDPTSPKRVAVAYAAFSLAVRLIACQSAVFSLWFGRRCYERSRGEMITMLHEKTLARKVAFQHEDEIDTKNDSNGTVDGDTPDDHAKGSESSFMQRTLQHLSALFKGTALPKLQKQPASKGKILNLMRNDVYEVAQRFWEFQSLITKPLSVIFSVTLVVRFLGSSSLLAVLGLILALVVSAILARIMVYYEKKRRAATDSKLQVVAQFVEAIRHLRWYGWQGTWLIQILQARQRELNIRVVTNVWNLLISLTNSMSLDLTPVVAFFAYTTIAGKPLRVDVAFPALQLFTMMAQSLRDLPNLIIVLINAWVAVGRIEDFMAEPDRQEMATEALMGDSLALDHASFSWPGASRPVLKNINLSFAEGLTVICGEVAAGKTALLQALLGEMDMLEGQLIRPPEPIGYCAQSPWLQSMSIRENILFSAPYDDERYKDVLDACALTPDLAEFTAGDLSLIGENGIGLSGGQRARVALARAVYSQTKILLLDDPVSALDQQTAEIIARKCFAGPLLRGRTVVLVTHRTDLVLAIADQVVRLESGRAEVLDHDTTAHESLERVTSVKSSDERQQQALQTMKQAAVPDKFIEDEHREHGGVKAMVYWEYIKAGRIQWWGCLIFLLVIYRLITVAETWFLKTWGEAYNQQPQLQLLFQTEDVIMTQADPFNNLPPPQENINPWLLGFLLLALSKTLILFVSRCIMVVIVYTSGKRMFKEIMDRVAHATFRFYDVTPVGRLMNRMTSDIGVIDGDISAQFQEVVWSSITWISSIIVVASITPVFLAFSALLVFAFVTIFLRFLPTSQSLRRLEMVSLTPLMSNFGTLLDGLVTVRAYHAQSRFQDRVFRVVDTFQKMDHFYWSLQAWLMYRFDALSATSTFLLTILALVTNVSPGLTAFVLIYANKIVGATHSLCRQYGQLQMEFVSVERVVELLHLDQEPKGKSSPPAWWPSQSGDMVFENVTMRYAPHLEPALKDVSFTIKGGSKTAIIGRTGSGKSTLALSMLATIVPEVGKITVDHVDLAEVDKQLLRTRVTFVAQDPVLFPGTMRSNLDPVGDHSDEECEAVLRQVCEKQGWDLQTNVEAGGRNLSQGQRQLVGLARAVLRRSAIIILDEATASIDRVTAAQIQKVMHEEMKESTVITIAHRLEAVRNADYCIVLGKGRVLKQGPAEEMLRRGKGDMDDGGNE